ncbi:ubiquitin-conjugating enzyme E2C-binding protein [Xylariaceae sp. FL0255]|nr:ubiquitin-conjugating enzyme E2C-binding protein [Xylariaceae sp. FL0255]
MSTSNLKPPILIYAELLSNIRQVSVACSLPNHSSLSSATKAIIASKGTTLTIIHNGATQTIELPARVISGELPISKNNNINNNSNDAETSTINLSWRLPLAAASPNGLRNHNTGPKATPTATSDELIPWSARDLQPGSVVRCRTCESTIIARDKLQVWKDLPSENWAEMMEFWHCHKPDTHPHGHDDKADGNQSKDNNGGHDGHDDEEHLTTRGYGASSRISAQPGVGFVDLTSFLVALSDLTNTQYSAPTATASEEQSNGSQPATVKTTSMSNSLRCSTCKTHFGLKNEDQSSVSIFKWQITVNPIDNKNTSTSTSTSPSTKNPPPPKTVLPTLSQCVSAMLLATMARSGCSKSIILPIKSQTSQTPSSQDVTTPKNLLHIWTFNPNITFSSTSASRPRISAIKVFYKTITQPEADKMLESMTSDVQDISLPADAIVSIVELLDASNLFVPESSRFFKGKEWKVGLLEKWDGDADGR